MLQFLVFIISDLNQGFMLLCCRDALSDLAIHFLDKIKVMVVKDIEREDIEFITKVRCQVYKISTPTILTGMSGFESSSKFSFLLRNPKIMSCRVYRSLLLVLILRQLNLVTYWQLVFIKSFNIIMSVSAYPN
jgi:hypothetical protein